MFKARIKCCYETLAEILNKIAIPNLGPGSRRAALPLRGHSADSHRMLPLSTSGSQRHRASLLPCQPAPSAACAAILLAASAGKVCTELADTQAQLPTNSLGQDKGQQPCQDHSGTHHGGGGGKGVPFCYKECNSTGRRPRSFTLLLKAGSHLNQQHIVTQLPSCRNTEKKLCSSPHRGLQYFTKPIHLPHSGGEPQRRPFEIDI